MSATKEEYETRLRAIEASLIEGMRHADLAAAAATKFGVSTQQIKLDIKKVMSRWKKAGTYLQKSPAANLAQAILRRQEVFRRALTNNDLPTALRAEQDSAKLLDLYPEEKHQHQHSGPGGAAIPITSIEIVESKRPEEPGEKSDAPDPSGDGGSPAGRQEGQQDPPASASGPAASVEL
jgi:hypothetical protein